MLLSRHALLRPPDDDGVEKSQEENSWFGWGECNIKVGNNLSCRTDECILESKKRDFLITMMNQFDVDKLYFGMRGLLSFKNKPFFKTFS